MANEISVSVSLSTSKNSVPFGVSKNSQSDQTGSGRYAEVITATTSWAQIVLTDVTPGLMLFKNEDATNFVELATDAAGVNKFARLNKGESALFRKNGDIHIKANTAPCSVLVAALDD